MRVIENEAYRIECFDAMVWKQERNIIRYKHKDADPVEIVGLYMVSGGSAKFLASYTLDANREAIIDVSDIIRAYPEVTGFQLDNDFDNPISISYTVVGLISPVTILRPATELTNFALLPPKRMLASIASGLSLQTEYYKTTVPADRYSIRLHKSDGTTTSITPISNTPKAFEIPANVVSYDVYFSLMRTVQLTGIISALQCGRTYAAVRWVSFTGQTRVHTFEVVKRKTEYVDTVNIMTIDGSYNRLKGREEGFSIMLEGLSTYDMWYYSDVCYSSKVEVSLDGTTWRQVDVTTNDVTIPDGDAGKLNTLEVELKYKKYDAIAM